VEKAEKEASDERRKTQEALFEAYLQQAKAGHSSRRVGQRFETLEAVRKAMQIGEELGITAEQRLGLRNAAIAGLALADMRVVREWPGWPAATIKMAFDGAHKRYARLFRHGEISVREVEGDREIVR